MMHGDTVYFGGRAVTLEVRSDGKMFITWPAGGNDMTGAIQARFEVSATDVSLTPPAPEEAPVAEPEAQPELEVQSESTADEPVNESTPDPEPFI
jgi:hypothetical protein